MFMFFSVYLADFLLSASDYNHTNFHTFKARIIIKYLK
jgi:hypothetical protein